MAAPGSLGYPPGPMRTPQTPRRELLAVAILTVVAAALRLYRVNHFAFWVDECLTIYAGRLPLVDGVELILLRDVHPPLFYVLLHFWLMISDQETFLRAFSVIPSVAAVPVLYLLAKTWFGSHRKTKLMRSSLVSEDGQKSGNCCSDQTLSISYFRHPARWSRLSEI